MEEKDTGQRTQSEKVTTSGCENEQVGNTSKEQQEMDQTGYLSVNEGPFDTSKAQKRTAPDDETSGTTSEEQVKKFHRTKEGWARTKNQDNKNKESLKQMDENKTPQVVKKSSSKVVKSKVAEFMALVSKTKNILNHSHATRRQKDMGETIKTLSDMRDSVYMMVVATERGQLGPKMERDFEEARADYDRIMENVLFIYLGYFIPAIH